MIIMRNEKRTYTLGYGITMEKYEKTSIMYYTVVILLYIIEIHD